MNDHERVDGYTRIGNSIFGGEIACDVKPLPHVDVKTFKVLPGTQYAKDTHRVYYPLETICVDGTDCGVCYYSRFVVLGANSGTIRYLDKDYSTDGQKVFFRGEALQGADPVTFKVISGPEYFYFAVDKARVYHHDQIFHNADPNSFFFDSSDIRNKKMSGIYVIADKSRKWIFSAPDSFQEVRNK